MTLADALIALQDPGSPVREDAAKAFVAWCESHVPKYLVRQFGADMAGTDMIEQAIVHLEIKAATQSPESRFRGSTEGEAVCWCQTIARNKARSWWRRHQRDHQAAKLAAGADVGTSATRHDPMARSAGSDSGSAKVEFEQAIRWLLAQVAGRAAAGELTALQAAQASVFIEHRLRLSTTKEQIANWSSRGTALRDQPETDGDTRPRDRVYKDRQRGREIVEKVLAGLTAASDEDDSIREELARILDVSTPSGGSRNGQSRHE